MHRCLVSLLLIAGLVISLQAAIPHAHAGMSGLERQEHGATPHFHSHDHGDHHHDGEKSEHHDADAALQQDEAFSKLVSESANFDVSGHNASAIVLVTQSIAISVTSKIAQKGSESPFAPSAIHAKTRIALWPLLRHEPSWQMPDALKDGSGIYLKLRNLRI